MEQPSNRTLSRTREASGTRLNGHLFDLSGFYETAGHSQGFFFHWPVFVLLFIHLGASIRTQVRDPRARQTMSGVLRQAILDGSIGEDAAGALLHELCNI